MTEQPDHLDIAVGLGFQAAAGAGTVQITVDVELQQISRRVARTTRRLRHRADKPKRREVQPADKCLDEPHRIVSSDVIVNRLRQEEQLRTVVTGKVCHAGFYRTTKNVGIPHIEFSHSLQGFCAVHYSPDIVPGWLRGRRSGVGASSQSSLRYVVRGGRVAPRGLQFWEMPDIAH